MPNATLRAALLDHAAACDADGMPMCAHAVRLASGRPHRPTSEADEAETHEINTLVEIFGDALLDEPPDSIPLRRCA